MNRLLLAAALAFSAAAPLAAQPDLRGGSVVALVRDYFEAGDSVFVSISASNSGSQASPDFPAAVYLSDDLVVTPDDSLLARVTIPGIAPQMNGGGGVRVRLPPGLARGAYYFLVRMDDPDTVAETDETNNVNSGRFTVGRVFDAPNLVVQTARTEDPVTEPGGRVSLEYRPANRGSQDVNDFDVGFYLIAENEFVTPRSQWRLLERETLGGLDAGEAEDEGEQVTIPANAAPGKYRIVLILDDRNRIVERRETDNQWYFGLRVVTSTAGESPPDALALGLRASPNPAGASVQVSYTLAEAGPVRLSVFDVLGRRVAVVAAGERGAGPHAEALDTSALPPGVYVARLASAAGLASVRFTVAR